MPFWRKKENRAEVVINTENMITTENIGASVLRALIGGNTPLSKSQAEGISAVCSCIKLIADKIASLPLKLYEKNGEKVTEITDDIRVRLLNGDTGDTLNATEMRREWINDYFLGKGAYTYIERDIFGDVKSLRYVREENICITSNADPIFKAYDIYVNGQKYYPHDFLKILRRNDGYGKGKSIAEENNLLLSVAYNTMQFENTLVKKGGNKKGFLKSKSRLDKVALDSLKAAFREIYSNNSDNDNVVVLNDGVDFEESSSTSVEMQLNENKLTNRDEICAILETPPEILSGKASEQVQALWVKNCIMPILNVIEAACDSDLLLESEKEKRYFAFDTVELTRGDFTSRMNGYAVALDKNVMQLDEVREREDLPPLGFNFIKLGLQDVLLDVKTNRIYTPNTNKFQDLGDMTPDTEIDAVPDMRAEELRYNPYHGENGRFTNKKFSSNAVRFSNGGAKGVDKSNGSDIIKAEINKIGIKGTVNIPPKYINVDELSYDENHINYEKSHNVPEKEAKQYVKKASVSITKWDGQFENYYSSDGASFVDVIDKSIRTAFTKDEYTDNVNRMMEVLDKHGK